MRYVTRRPHIADHMIVDLSAARRAFVFGDVHGSLGVLKDALASVFFDASLGDVAICVGDWMDRGPAGLVETRDFLKANPAIRWTRGNHEDILRNACHEGGRRSIDDSAGDLIRNGGRWAFNHIDEDTGYADADLVAFADLLNDAPIAMTVLTPGGRRVGIVHAAVPHQSWDGMVAALEGPDPLREDMAFHCMWDRDAADMAIDRRDEGRPFGYGVDGIDHVFHGHTKMGREPLTFGNVSWIDTGAYKTGVLTLLDIDAFLADLGEPSPHAR